MNGPWPSRLGVECFDVPIDRVPLPRLGRASETEQVDEQETMGASEGRDPAVPVAGRPADTVEEDQRRAALAEPLVAQRRPTLSSPLHPGLAAGVPSPRRPPDGAPRCRYAPGKSPDPLPRLQSGPLPRPHKLRHYTARALIAVKFDVNHGCGAIHIGYPHAGVSHNLRSIRWAVSALDSGSGILIGRIMGGSSGRGALGVLLPGNILA